MPQPSDVPTSGRSEEEIGRIERPTRLNRISRHQVASRISQSLDSLSPHRLFSRCPPASAASPLPPLQRQCRSDPAREQLNYAK
ncbi:unnamed protein product [Protopolystoma xenopodis]|uniref:Uncharacterized protein n=1 Tax=Protopolystoma xenopodis TaxID=117903 RepID=A0A3S5CGF5_9PLAT|nr:unnamed protein product [Protopolystoma xenopodis]